MKLAILMDPPARLNPAKDTTVGMIKSAARLGWDCVFFTQNDMLYRDGRVFAHVYSLHPEEISAPDWPRITAQGEMPLAAFDCILMRRDPPFDLEYIYATYLLELAEKEGVRVVNTPQSLRDCNEKMMTLQFPQCCPETLVARDMRALRAFWQQHQEVIFKPLAGMGGQNVFHVDLAGRNLSVILENLTQHGTVSIMAQRYIPEITTCGDKRILMVHGKPIAYALARIPGKGELRGNLAAGARGEVVALTPRDRWIAKQVGPVLLAKGLLFTGLDVIGAYLTEINVTSPTCAREIENATGLDITGDFLQGLR